MFYVQYLKLVSGFLIFGFCLTSRVNGYSYICVYKCILLCKLNCNENFQWLNVFFINLSKVVNKSGLSRGIENHIIKCKKITTEAEGNFLQLLSLRT